MPALTSTTHPLRIDRVQTPLAGSLGLTFCPGKQDAHAQCGAWSRDLETDLHAITDWPASVLLTLIEDHEFELLGVPDLGKQAQAMGFEWHHLPIRDVSVPDARFIEAWPDCSQRLQTALAAGQNVVMHCRGGLGRTGLVACQLLVDLGIAPEAALAQVRAARPRTVESREQEVWVLGLEG